MTAIYLIFWAAIGAAVGAAIGERKGRVDYGLCAGALLGPLGWMLVAASPGKPSAMGLRKCPSCAEFVKKEALKCKHCQSDLEPIAKKEPFKAEETGSGRVAIYFALGVLVLVMAMVAAGFN